MLSSLLTRKNIIIAAVVVAVILVTIGVVIVIKSNNSSPPIPPNPAIFKRCDGSSDPVEQITLSSCPDVNEVGYCEVFSYIPSILEMSFTPAEDCDDTRLYLNVETPRISETFDPCQSGVRCPLKKGRTETLKNEFLGGYWYNTTKYPDPVKVGIFRNADYPRNPIYCVQFPVKMGGYYAKESCYN